MKVLISICPRKIAWVMALAALGLVLASIVGSIWTRMPVEGELLIEIRESYVRLFYLDWEANVPTWFSSSQLLLCASLLAIIALAKKTNGDRYVVHWSALSMIFLYLSIDDAAVIHEMANKPLQSLRNVSGVFYDAWILPASACVFVFVLAYLRFLAHLPAQTRRLFVIAGAIFVGGAIGAEAVGAYHAHLHGEGTLTYAMIITVEEFLEMLGLVVFTYSLLDYMRSWLPELALGIGDASLVPVEREEMLDQLQPARECLMEKNVANTPHFR